ncbi:MAG: hypothetical protein ACI8XU_002546 [Kiritimatiellia bacterium]
MRSWLFGSSITLTRINLVRIISLIGTLNKVFTLFKDLVMFSVLVKL